MFPAGLPTLGWTMWCGNDWVDNLVDEDKDLDGPRIVAAFAEGQPSVAARRGGGEVVELRCEYDPATRTGRVAPRCAAGDATGSRTASRAR